ncbi:RING finger protein 10 [Vitis vinifera]|uniref:RING finger protein 10 n=1 Tax=Vitis vinifera TaxID=29760 RepID=A0A438EC62_VITVI|nr:RING finger protein 10 [Vitis vinifera]
MECQGGSFVGQTAGIRKLIAESDSNTPLGGQPSSWEEMRNLLFDDSSTSLSCLDEGSLAPAAADSGGSSKKVTELGVQNSKKSLPHQNTGTRSQSRSVGRGSESTQSRGKLSGPTISPRSQQASGSINFHGSTTHSAGRKTQMNGNHLLNFHYDPISRPQPRAPPPRRQQKIKPYNKDLFLQANYRFVVLDTGNQVPELMDPDKMLQWDDIICVRYSTPLPVQCPICLECPLCPQITSCGHIFCFPCILRYLLMGKEDHKEFMLLTRQKDSFTLSEKNKQETDVMPCNSEVHDSFSKFIFTSDVDLSVREAISDLDSWLVRADSGLVDDLEKLPYVCAAVEQLEQRKKYWNEHGTYKSTISVKYTDGQSGSHVIPSTTNVACSDYEACGFKYGSPSSDVDDKSKWLGNLTPDKLDGGECLVQTADVGETLEGQCRALSSSYDENKSLQRHSSGSRDLKDDDSYNFYQAVDGQHLILHPLNMKCLLHHYGGYAFLPNRISGRILQLETVTQSEAMRRRYRYLSHFSLTTTFQLCEIDLREVLPPSAFFPFMDEIKKRERQRKKLARKDTKEKLKAEATTTDSLPIPSRFGEYVYPPTFSMDDFEALGSPVVTSTSPPTFGERKLFSNVTKLGFAAGHDSPGLKIEEVHSVHSTSMASDSSGVTGSRNAGTPSFANVISRGKSVESLDASKTIGTGKKGKKSNQILLSTAGGRRY